MHQRGWSEDVSPLQPSVEEGTELFRMQQISYGTRPSRLASSSVRVLTE